MYTIKEFSEAVYTMGDHEWTLQIEYDDTSTKTKLTSTRFGSTFGTLRFVEESFFIICLVFTPFWDYTPTYASHADSPGVYTSDKFFNLSKTDKNQLKFWCHCWFRSKWNTPVGSFSFILDTQAGYKTFCEPETIHHKTINKPFLNTITFCPGKDNHEEKIFNGWTLTFTLQMIKIWTIQRALKNLKLKVIALVKNTILAQKRNIFGEITYNEKTCIEIILLVGKSVILWFKKTYDC